MAQAESSHAYQKLKYKKNYRALFELQATKAVIRVFLTGHTVSMVNYCVTNMVTTRLPMVRQYFDTMVVASTNKEWL